MVFLLEQKHRIMVTYDMLFNSLLTNLEKITEQRNKLIMVNQRAALNPSGGGNLRLPEFSLWEDLATTQILTLQKSKTHDGKCVTRSISKG
jgi:hypothetical protein